MPRRNSTTKSSYKPSKPAGYKYGKPRDDEPQKSQLVDLVSDLPPAWGAPEPVKPKAPGKDRLFQQQYQHKLYAKGEGYSSVYQLKIKAEDYDKIQRMLDRKGISEEFEPHVLEFLQDGFLVHDHWDRVENDLKLVSTKLKNVLLAVEVFGEDFPDDACMYYVMNGKSYYADGEMVYPQFDATLLM